MNDENRARKGKKGKGNGDVLDLTEGLTAVEQGDLAAFEQAMADNVVPRIVEVVEERRLKAAESRQRQLKC